MSKTEYNIAWNNQKLQIRWRRISYSFKSENNGCSIYMSNIFYGHAPLKSSLFLLNLDSSDTHIHSVETKRCRVDNDSATYLWHCRLGHIGVKRMKKLHTDGLLEPLDYESLGTCEPCLMGKMTKTPFSGTMERVTDLLEIILLEICPRGNNKLVIIIFPCS